MKTRASTSAWSLFLTVHAVVVGAIGKRLADAGLPSLDWYDALWALERAPDHRLRMHEFERWMVISRSNITRLVDRLEAAGLVRRERAHDDRRSAFAVLTPEGSKMRQRMWSVYETAIDSLFHEPLSDDELRIAESIFRKLLDPHTRPNDG